MTKLQGYLTLEGPESRDAVNCAKQEKMMGRIHPAHGRSCDYYIFKMRNDESCDRRHAGRSGVCFFQLMGGARLLGRLRFLALAGNKKRRYGNIGISEVR